MLTAKRYTPQLADEWNALVAASRNGTFLLDRRYMDYHSHRFTDCSLLFCDNGHAIAALPACVADGVVTCHGGLTYGPLVVSTAADNAAIHECFTLACNAYRQQGAHALLYKPIPYIYADGCADDDLYEMFRLKARLKARTLSTAVYMPKPLRMHELRRRCVNKALRHRLTITTEHDPAAFVQILSSVLAERHNVHPVHTAAEMQLLMERFPNNIKLYCVYDGATLVAGTWVFVTPRVVHLQYIAANDEGRAKGALDLLFNRFLNGEFPRQEWLDFGISTEQGGTVLNQGLLWQKEGFGGRGVCYDMYEIDL